MSSRIHKVLKYAAKLSCTPRNTAKKIVRISPRALVQFSNLFPKLSIFAFIGALSISLGCWGYEQQCGNAFTRSSAPMSAVAPSPKIKSPPKNESPEAFDTFLRPRTIYPDQSPAMAKLRTRSLLPSEFQFPELQRINQREVLHLEEYDQLIARYGVTADNRGIWTQLSEFVIRDRYATLEDLRQLAPQELWLGREDPSLRDYFRQAIQAKYDQERVYARLGSAHTIEHIANYSTYWSRVEFEFFRFIESSHLLPGTDGLALLKEIITKGINGFNIQTWQGKNRQAAYKKMVIVTIYHYPGAAPSYIVRGQLSILDDFIRHLNPPKDGDSRTTLNDPYHDHLILTPELALPGNKNLPAIPIRLTTSLGLHQKSHLSSDFSTHTPQLQLPNISFATRILHSLQENMELKTEEVGP